MCHCKVFLIINTFAQVCPVASGVHASSYFPSEFLSTCFSNISLILTSTLLTSLCCPHDSYPCVDIVAMGRGNSSHPSSAQFIAVDLAHPSQVAAAAALLAKKWYSDSVSSTSQSLPGHDIVINNAGVFTGIDSGALFALSQLCNFLVVLSRDHLGHKHPCTYPYISRDY